MPSYQVCYLMLHKLYKFTGTRETIFVGDRISRVIQSPLKTWSHCASISYVCVYDIIYIVWICTEYLQTSAAILRFISAEQKLFISHMIAQCNVYLKIASEFIRALNIFSKQLSIWFIHKYNMFKGKKKKKY